VSASALVSVCIPCYNAQRFIGETLESVFGQTWPAIEVVVVDDGSTDDSAAVISQFSQQNLRLIKKNNEGQTVALNVCLSNSTGEFIQFLDADDIISRDKIERQVKRLIGRPDCVASAEWARFYSEASEAQFRAEPVWRDLNSLDWLALSREDGLGMMFPALWLVPRSLVNRIGPWHPELTLNNDAEYFTRMLLSANEVLFCEGARAYYRSGIQASLSGTRSRVGWVSQYKVLDLCEMRVLAVENSERMRMGFALSWQHFAHACYPYERAFAEEALRRARRLYPITIEPDGGPTFRAASRLLGWRLARRLQVLSGRK
jgi:glycosyltransferase involved in cell wall biosynthesis